MTSRRTRRAFIGTAAAGVTWSWLASCLPVLRAQTADSRLEILVGEPIGAIAPEIDGHFVKHLGGIVYDGIWVGEQSKIPHVNGMRKALVLLVAGEMDTNVDPSSTMHVVNQLIKHDKDFDLLDIPGAGHGPGGAYAEHKRFDFFVRQLLGVTPPAWTKKDQKAPTAGQEMQ